MAQAIAIKSYENLWNIWEFFMKIEYIICNELRDKKATKIKQKEQENSNRTRIQHLEIIKPRESTQTAYLFLSHTNAIPLAQSPIRRIF